MSRFDQLESEVRGLRSRQRDEDRAARLAGAEDVIFDNGRQLKIRSANGKYWGITVSDAGAFVLTDLGTTL